MKQQFSNNEPIQILNNEKMSSKEKTTILTSIDNVYEMEIDALIKTSEFQKMTLWFSTSNDVYLLAFKQSNSIYSIQFHFSINQLNYIEKTSEQFFNKLLNDFKKELIYVKTFTTTSILYHPMTKYLFSKLPKDEQLYMTLEYDLKIL